MFRFATDGRVRWPLSIDQVQEDGTTVAQAFGVQFTILTRDELRDREKRLQVYNRQLTALYPADAAKDSDELAAQRWELTEKRVAEDDDLLRGRVTGWDSIADQDGKAIAFSPAMLDALLASPLMRQTLLAGLIDASLGASAKNSSPGLAGMPARAQA